MSVELCPRFHKAIELVGSRWTGAILQVLMAGRARFSAIGDAIPDISDRMLSERLQVLEHEGLVRRTVLPDPPIRVEYELTDKGGELQASLAAVARWAERWLPVEPSMKTAASVEPGSAGHRSGRQARTARTAGPSRRAERKSRAGAR